ncbi:MAG: ABC transporter permease [Anaerostipes sp.]|nr:ABC transporter permease [Anaerostipes sp.]
MTVFKGYLLMAKRNLGILFMYVGIFLGVTMMIQASYAESGNNSMFQSKKMDIAVVTRGQGDVADGLKKMLEKNHNIVPVKQSKKALQEQIYYRSIEYVVDIPADLDRRIQTDGKVKVTKVPGTSSGYYMDQQITNYLSQIRLYQKGGFSLKESVKKAAAAQKVTPKVKLIDVNGNGGAVPKHFYMFRFMPYMYICVMCYVMSIIITEFQKKDIRNRMLCSKTSFKSQNLQFMGAFLFVGIVFWMFSLLLPILLCGSSYLNDVNLKYYIINSFLFFLVSLAMAFLVGLLVKNTTALSGVVNVISLGMCFLGGVFVSLNMLGEQVRKVAQFLPTYWYSKAIDLLGESGVLTASQRSTMYTSFRIELAFTVACLCVALAYLRYQRQERD